MKYNEKHYEYEARAKELVAKMTVDELMDQLRYNAPEIKRLGVPSYNYWNEALHGVARAGTATVFPQAIGLAATFDPEILYTVADIISTEGRAKFNEAQKYGDHDIYKGLTYWSPNINIFRDPRWGRGHETYGEDPWLTSILGISFVNGIQGDDDTYMKAAACAKHYAVHSGPEKDRHSFDAVVSLKDLRETYLVAFRNLVKEAQVEAVMGAYNRTNGEACCGSKTLLEDILRKEWGFKGHVVSDCWAIRDFHEHHKITKDILESIALALETGCDCNCGNCYEVLPAAFEKGYVKEEIIRRSAIRLFTTRMKLGLFDSKESVPFNKIPYEVNDCAEHTKVNLEVAQKTLVLLKNKNELLPLKRESLKSIAIIGPNADSVQILKGNYCGTPSQVFTVLDGIRTFLGDSTRIFYSEGSHLYKRKVEGLAGEKDRFAEAISAVNHSDVVLFALGLDPSIEGEEGDASNEYAAGDKHDLNFPVIQQELLQTVTEAAKKVNKPVILVVCAGSAIALGWADEHVDAIIHAWYPGAMGGLAIAELIFGAFSPSGRLPVTFYRDTADLPDFKDYSMKNRTYRYFTGDALYPFGYGLSFTKFSYSNFVLPKTSKIGENINCSATVTNIGKRGAEETVQLYVSVPGSGKEFPIRELRGIKKISLLPGEKADFTFTISPRDLSSIDENGNRVLYPGKYTISIGGHQGDARSEILTGQKAVSGTVEIVGNELKMEY